MSSTINYLDRKAGDIYLMYFISYNGTFLLYSSYFYSPIFALRADAQGSPVRLQLVIIVLSAAEVVLVCVPVQCLYY